MLYKIHIYDKAAVDPIEALTEKLLKLWESLSGSLATTPLGTFTQGLGHARHTKKAHVTFPVIMCFRANIYFGIAVLLYYI